MARTDLDNSTWLGGGVRRSRLAPEGTESAMTVLAPLGSSPSTPTTTRSSSGGAWTCYPMPSPKARLTLPTLPTSPTGCSLEEARVPDLRDPSTRQRGGTWGLQTVNEPDYLEERRLLGRAPPAGRPAPVYRGNLRPPQSCGLARGWLWCAARAVGASWLVDLLGEGLDFEVVCGTCGAETTMRMG